MSMDHILDEKEGAELTIYDIIARRFYDTNDRGRNIQRIELFIVYRNEKGEKKVKRIVDPPMEIYFVKPEYRNQFLTPREYLEMDKLYSAKVPATNVLKRVYDEMCKSNDPVAERLIKVYNDAIVTKNYGARKEIFKWPYTLMSDMDVVEYYWVQLGYHYHLNHGHIINQAFADIENDIYGLTSAEQEMNLDPVNACTVIFAFDQNGEVKREYEVYTYLLRNHKRYPQQAEFERNLNKFYRTCHEKFDKQTVIKKGKAKIIDVPARYQVIMCDTEEELLKSIFQKINSEKPDICQFWNMPYDMPKMSNRMTNIGLNPVNVITDDDMFPEESRMIQWHIDNRAIDIAERNSYIRMTSTTQYIDQMQNYAGIRKGRKAYGSNKLDNIANIELGMGKWKFPKGIDVTNACIKDYWDFVLYNIRDVWCQVLIDKVTNDSMTIIYDMNQQNCPLYHLMKQTRYQKYIYYCNYMRKGFIPGNNINTNYIRFRSEEEQEQADIAAKRRRVREQLDRAGIDADDIEQIMAELSDDDIGEYDAEDLDAFGSGSEKQSDSDDVDNELNDIAVAQIAETASNSMANFKDRPDRKLPLQGGLVGNPNFNSANGTELIPGIPSKHVQDDVMDEDYASEYPWAKYTRSLSRSTQIGRLIIRDKVSDWQNKLPLNMVKRASDNRNYIPGAEFTSDYISQDYLMFAMAWFGLPDVMEMNDILDRELGIADATIESMDLEDDQG